MVAFAGAGLGIGLRVLDGGDSGDAWGDPDLARRVLGLVAHGGSPVLLGELSAGCGGTLPDFGDHPLAFAEVPFFVWVIGLFIGWYLWSFKKTLPDGERIFAYSYKDRRHGKRIFYLSIIVFVLNIVTVIIYNTYFRKY